MATNRIYVAGYVQEFMVHCLHRNTNSCSLVRQDCVSRLHSLFAEAFPRFGKDRGCLCYKPIERIRGSMKLNESEYCSNRGKDPESAAI